MGDLWGLQPPLIADRERNARMRFVLKNTRRRRPPVKRDRRIVTKFPEFVTILKSLLDIFSIECAAVTTTSSGGQILFLIAHRCSWSQCYCLCTDILAKFIDV